MLMVGGDRLSPFLRWCIAQASSKIQISANHVQPSSSTEPHLQLHPVIQRDKRRSKGCKINLLVSVLIVTIILTILGFSA